MQICGLHERDGGWYVTTFQVLDKQGTILCDLQKTDWADWDRNGDLLFATEGKLYRLSPDFQSTSIFEIVKARELADFSENRFEEKVEPRT